jgi:hypothetical protein
MVSFDTHAKCVYAWYSISGKVTTSTNRPISAVSVSVSWSDAAGDRKEQSKTLKDGSYRLEFASSTQSGPGSVPGHDACFSTLKAAEVIFRAPGYETATRKATFMDSKVIVDVVLKRRAAGA